MTVNELVTLFAQFTDQHYAKAEAQPFFRSIHAMCLKGMGVGIGGDVASSGEQNAMTFIRSELTKKYPDQTHVLFDVGANIGNFTRAAIGVFGTDATAYHCFEPSSAALPLLVANLRGYSKVQFHHVALSDSNEQDLAFYADAAGSSQSSLYARRLDHYGLAISETERVASQTLTDFCQSHSIDRVHFLKLDVEGHELKVLKGGSDMIKAGKIDFIQFEFGGTNIDARTYFQDFWYELPNYRICRIIRDGLVEIPQYRESEEMFGAQNYLAILKS